LEKLWDIIDDIDTYGDMAKSDDKLYRSLVERRQRQRFEQTGISTDGYELNGGAVTALRQAIAEAERHISYVCPNCHWSLNRQEPDDLYDVWVEQETCQQNRQVAMRKTTREEKIVNPGVYEVPDGFECPRCGHCCRVDWVGLDHEMMRNTSLEFNRGALWAERWLKEKNT